MLFFFFFSLYENYLFHAATILFICFSKGRRQGVYIKNYFLLLSLPDERRISTTHIFHSPYINSGPKEKGRRVFSLFFDKLVKKYKKINKIRTTRLLIRLKFVVSLLQYRPSGIYFSTRKYPTSWPVRGVNWCDMGKKDLHYFLACSIIVFV